VRCKVANTMAMNSATVAACRTQAAPANKQEEDRDNDDYSLVYHAHGGGEGL
jgi:hypothetical protein